MRILVDTNVILDVILQREPFYEDSKRILMACQSNSKIITVGDGMLEPLSFFISSFLF